MPLAPPRINGPIASSVVPHIAPGVDAPAYLERLETLLGHWLTLSGYDRTALEYFQAFTSNLHPMPPYPAWKEYSRLCPDGSPVQFCEIVSHSVSGPAFIVDPGPYGAPAEMRLQVAADLASEALARSSSATATISRIQSLLAAVREREPDLALCLGYSSGRIGIYFTANSHLRSATWRTMIASLPGFRAQTNASKSVLALLAHYGHRTAVALQIGASGDRSTDISFRIAKANSPLLDSAATSAGLSPAPFRLFLRRILQQRDAWQDVKATAAVRISDEGAVEELSFIIDARRYFRTDDELRTTVLSVAPDFDWDISLFRPASRLLASPGSRPVRSSVAISALPAGASRLRIFSKTGHHAVETIGQHPHS